MAVNLKILSDLAPEATTSMQRDIMAGKDSEIDGPVYADVYTLFRDFKYNPIDDARFAMLGGNADSLTADEKKVVELVVRTFGMYGGKVLERITHNEKPWKEARKGYMDTIPSHELISKASIREYYKRINEIYRIDSEEGLTEYIRQML